MEFEAFDGASCPRTVDAERARRYCISGANFCKAKCPENPGFRFRKNRIGRSSLTGDLPPDPLADDIEYGDYQRVICTRRGDNAALGRIEIVSSRVCKIRETHRDV